jgi:hypothetical protein
MIENFKSTIDFWINALQQYEFDQLCAKPSPNSWSLGQVYVHLIENTRFFLEQAKLCLSSNDNESEESSPEAKTMFLNNEFPDVILEGPPSNALTQQPNSKMELLNDLMDLKEEVAIVGNQLLQSDSKGKVKHVGLNYFSAHEWFQFAEIHIRHHLRQKARIDLYLQANYSANSL